MLEYIDHYLSFTNTVPGAEKQTTTKPVKVSETSARPAQDVKSDKVSSGPAETFEEREKRYKREYYERNKERLRKKAREYMRKRRST